MEVFIIIGIIVFIAIGMKHLASRGKFGEELDCGLNERIRLNEIRAVWTQKTGGIENENDQENVNNMENSVEEKWDTFNIIETILAELGCQPKKENDRELKVSYQGENFVIKIGGPYAQIWDPCWSKMNVNDPNFENMKMAVNVSNFEFGPTIVWSGPNEDGSVWLHSKREILLCPQMDDNKSYITSVLDSFFETKDIMRIKFRSLISQEQQTPKPNRPVGFATEE